MDSSNLTFDSSIEEIDPNTLWEAADKLTASTPKRVETTAHPDDSTSISSIALNDNPIEAVVGLHKNLSTFWTTYESHFRNFWDKMYPKSRENFLRDVYPTIVQSLSDRYCYLDGEKVYEKRYDRYLLLTIDMIAVSELSNGNNLPELVSSLVQKDALSTLAAHMVTLLRRLYKQNYFPFTQSEREAELKQFNIVKGSILIANHPNNFAGGFQVDKPEYIKKSFGGQVNLFETGVFSYPFEFDIVLENLVFMYGMIGAFVDEFRVEVLRQGQGKNVKICSPQYACGFCGMSGGKLLVCGKCGITMYCSKDCQKRHWPQHKKLCKILTAKGSNTPKEQQQGKPSTEEVEENEASSSSSK